MIDITSVGPCRRCRNEGSMIDWACRACGWVDIASQLRHFRSLMVDPDPDVFEILGAAADALEAADNSATVEARLEAGQQRAEARRSLALQTGGQLYQHAIVNGKATAEQVLEAAHKFETYIISGIRPGLPPLDNVTIMTPVKT